MCIIQTVAVGSDILKPFTHALALGFYSRVPTEGSSKRLFYFLHNRQGALADGLHGLNPRNTALFTPESKRRPALIWRLVKQLVHGGEQGQLYKRTNPSSALGAFWFFNVNRSQ